MGAVPCSLRKLPKLIKVSKTTKVKQQTKTAKATPDRFRKTAKLLTKILEKTEMILTKLPRVSNAMGTREPGEVIMDISNKGNSDTKLSTNEPKC